jgi:hypothetical protein
LSFAVGQLAFPWLLVPAACGVLVYVQARLGLLRPVGLSFTVSLCAAALVQSVLAARLLPLGVRLLARDFRLGASVGKRARTNALVSAGLLGGTAALSWAMSHVPGLVHPWLRVVLSWTALRPVMAYAAVCLLHAVLLGRCGSALVDKDGTSAERGGVDTKVSV